MVLLDSDNSTDGGGQTFDGARITYFYCHLNCQNQEWNWTKNDFMGDGFSELFSKKSRNY